MPLPYLLQQPDRSTGRRSLPPRGTEITLATVVADLNDLIARVRHPAIVHATAYEPWWVDGDTDPETGDFVHYPEFRGARWIEIYNGYRE